MVDIFVLMRFTRQLLTGGHQLVVFVSSVSHDVPTVAVIPQPYVKNALPLLGQAASGYDVVVCPPNWVQFPEPFPGRLSTVGNR